MSYGGFHGGLGPSHLFFFSCRICKYVDSKTEIIGVCRGEKKGLYWLLKQSLSFQLDFTREALHVGDYQVLAHLSIVCSIMSHLDMDPYINSLS